MHQLQRTARVRDDVSVARQPLKLAITRARARKTFNRGNSIHPSLPNEIGRVASEVVRNLRKTQVRNGSEVSGCGAGIACSQAVAFEDGDTLAT
jgi:hypothetical protein